MIIETINPSTEEQIASYSLMTELEINRDLKKGKDAFNSWKKTTFSQRKTLMQVFAKTLDKNKERIARLIVMEMGKPITEAKAEIDKCILLCDHYAENAELYLEPRLIPDAQRSIMVCYNPLGLILGIMPWNFPLWQVLRFAVPTLMAGNGVVLKHAPISTGLGNLIVELFQEAGFPDHLFQHFILDNVLAERLIAHEFIVGVSLTGSEAAGSIVASTAAKHIKKAVLELGGSDPYLVLEDADLDLAASSIVNSRIRNCGQTCIAAKRIIVIESVALALIDKIQRLMLNFVMGDPMLAETNLGPMARSDLRDKLHDQVLKSIASGARLLMGGKIPDRRGFYYPPTLLVDVHQGMPAYDEELFGPVISVISVANEKEGIAIANDSNYGLGAAVFTSDLIRGEKIAREQLEAGSCFVNNYVTSDPRIPFGGIKHSGFGRELSKEGIHEFVNIKTVVVYGSGQSN